MLYMICFVWEEPSTLDKTRWNENQIIFETESEQSFFSLFSRVFSEQERESVKREEKSIYMYKSVYYTQSSATFACSDR